jgi:hypothetical protein
LGALLEGRQAAFPANLCFRSNSQSLFEGGTRKASLRAEWGLFGHAKYIV